LSTASSFVYRKHHPAYSKHHPALQWLPTKLAEWIANNLQDELMMLFVLAIKMHVLAIPVFTCPF